MFELIQALAYLPGIHVTSLALAAGYCGWGAWNALYQARTIEDIPTCKIRSAPQGYVELEGVGRLMDSPPIFAPLSGRPCLWYRFHIERDDAIGGAGVLQRRWHRVEGGASSDTFWLEDDTGRVVVDPEGAEVMARHKDVWQANAVPHPLKASEDLVRRLAALPAGKSYRFTEERLNSGDRLYAIGRLKNIDVYPDKPTGDAEVTDLLRKWKANQPALTARFDLNHDGRIDEREWMLARAQARRDVVKGRQQTQQQLVDGVNMLGRTGERARPYLLSAFPQTQLQTRLRWYAAVYGAGFFVAGAWAVWLFNARFPG